MSETRIDRAKLRAETEWWFQEFGGGFGGREPIASNKHTILALLDALDAADARVKALETEVLTSRALLKHADHHLKQRMIEHDGSIVGAELQSLRRDIAEYLSHEPRVNK